MADSDTLDHRAELMRKWSNDKALMAQAGLLHAEAYESDMHLEAAMRHKTHTSKLRIAGVTPTVGKKKKNKSKAKTSKLHERRDNLIETLLLERLKHSHVESNHGKKNHEKKKHRQNGHITSKETVHELDDKVSVYYQKYKTALDDAFTLISKKIAELPVPNNNRDNSTISVLKSTVSKSVKDINNYLNGKNNTFPDAFLSIAEGLYAHITTTNYAVRYNHKLIYPPFYNFGNDKLKVMRKGYFVHEILTMVCFFLMRNMKSEGMVVHKDEIQEVVHTLLKYKRETDKIYKQLIKLKQGLDFKVKHEKQSGSVIDHSSLKNLREDFEEGLHHDGSFRLSNPYE